MPETSAQESLTPETMRERVELALAEAKRLGADQAEVAVSHDSGLAATARLGEVENL